MVPLPTVPPRDRVRARWLAAVVLVSITITPVILTWDVWRQWGTSALPRTIDGSSHLALAHLYRETIFPDTFGWVPEIFAGMPFPNYYPPGFYWMVAATAKAFGSADTIAGTAVIVKTLVFVPMLLLPAGIWALAYQASGGRIATAHLAALLSLVPLIRPGFHGEWASGLEYFSTFAVGLYTQPAAFLYLLAWCALDLGTAAAPPRTIARALLFAAALLTNVYVAMTSVLLAAAGVLSDAIHCAAARRGFAGPAARALSYRLASLALAAAIAAFWYVPMAWSYAYVVTRPLGEVFETFTPAMMGWYAASFAGSAVVWRVWPGARRLLAGLAMLCLFVAAPAAWLPAWFPLQGGRFASALSLLCSVPLAGGVVLACDALAARLAPARWRVLPAAYAVTTVLPLGLALALPLLALTRTSKDGLRLLNRFWSDAAFYHDEAEAHGRAPFGDAAWLATRPAWRADAVRAAASHFGSTDGRRALEAILAFGRTHRDGRYLVEFPNPYDLALPSFDAHAIGAYLAAQGNEALGGAMRESAATALFINPQKNAISASADLFGLSSRLGVDRDFADQPLAQHLARCRALGVRYLVAFTPSTIARLAQSDALLSRLTASGWIVYELREPPAPRAETLRMRPALVFGPLAMKARRSGDLSFTRLAEEQFFDNWFDVLLARAPQDAIDRVDRLDTFGALVLLTYDCRDCEGAYTTLRAFAQQRTVIAVAAEDRLFHKLEMNRDQLPGLVILDRPPAGGDWMRGFYGPRERYGDSPIRHLWIALRAALDRTKQPGDAPGASADISADISAATIRLQLASPSRQAMVLYRGSHHPAWTRADGEPVYAAGPMFMLTAVRDTATLSFSRAPVERFGAALSATTMAGIIAWPAAVRLRRRVRQAAHAVRP